MKLKQRPEDFQVEELTDVRPSEGPFALYRLTKSGWTTPDALGVIRRRWKLDHRRLSYGGLKDRHALTAQYLTVFRGPQRQLNQQGIRVEYLGQVPEPYDSKHIRANRFLLTLRQIPEADLPALTAAWGELQRDGLPNYFDDQRFGSVSAGSAFLARELILGRPEEALRLALTAPYEYDRGEQKKEKALLRKHWGDWPALCEKLPRGHARSLAHYLADHPGDFAGAVERLRPELRGLYLSAYQSHLWNRTLAGWASDRVRPAAWTALPLKLGEFPIPVGLDEAQKAELGDVQLPLAAAKVSLEPDDPRWPYLNAVLAEEGVTLEQFRLKGYRDLFFSRGNRAAWVWPSACEMAAHPDDLHPGKHKVELGFELPRGCYATLIVKRVSGR